MPETRPATLYDVITSEAQSAKVPPELALAVAQQESGFNPTAASPKGARGIFQLMPETAAGLGVTDPDDPVQNIRGGVKYLRQQLEASGGDIQGALARYNFGPGNIAKGRPLPTETTDYVQKVMKETDFRRWYGQHAATQQLDPNPDAPEHFYDYRAAHDAGAQPDESGHWPSQFKKAGHPNLVVGGVDTRIGIPPMQPVASHAQPGEEGPVGAPPPTPEKKGWIRSTLEGLDPRTPEGRRNIAGGIGAASGAILAAPTAAVSGPIGPGTGAVLGAMTAGGLVGGGEALIRRLVGTAPPNESVVGQFGHAATEQGLYEMGGQAALWPVRALGRRLVATRVGRYATEGLSQQKQALSTQLQSALDSAKTLLRSTKASTRGDVSAAATTARQGVKGAEAAGAGRVSQAEAMGKAGVTQAEAQAGAGAERAAQPYDQMVGAPPPTPATAGRQANEVIQEGGAARARDQLGQAVDKAAESGPDVDISQLKGEARKILEKEIKPPNESFPHGTPDSGVLSDEVVAANSGFAPERVTELRAKAAAGDTRAAENLANIEAAVRAQPEVAAAQAESRKEILKHPALGVVNRILNAEDTVPFKDAHLFKRELDEAIGSTWDQSARKRVTNITKVLRGNLRGALAGHEPYNQATAAYAKVAPLYTQGIAPKLRKLAVEKPEAVVSMLVPKEPTHAVMLHDVLVNQAAEGGDAAGGQAAWDSVRSAWTHEKVVKGGLDTLGKRMDALEAQPEFHKVMFGDATGKQVWNNLRTIQSAYQTALEHGEAGVQRATEAGKAGVAGARQAASQGVEAARAAGQRDVQAARGVREAVVEHRQVGVESARASQRTGLAGVKAEQDRLASSSIAKRRKDQTTGDILRALAYGPHRALGAISVGRLMHGPTAADLVHWAAMSPKGTRALVWALTSSAPETAVADLARGAGILSDSGDENVGRRPPAATPVGQPPPGPPTSQVAAR